MPALLNIRSRRPLDEDLVDRGLDRRRVGDVEPRGPGVGAKCRGGAFGGVAIDVGAGDRGRLRSASARHSAAPMLDPAPVTIACLPAKLHWGLRQFHHVEEVFGVALQVGAAVQVEHVSGQPGRRRGEGTGRPWRCPRVCLPAERDVLQVLLDDAGHRAAAPSVSGVNTKPGTTALIRIPRGPTPMTRPE